MRRVLYGTGITALFTAVILLATATFSQSQALNVQWIYANCAEGKLLSAKYDPEHAAVVTGSAAFCALRVLDSSFGVAVYKAGATTVNILSYNLRKYPANTGEKREFGMYVSGKPGTFGVCLVASPVKKLACGKVVFKDSGYVEFREVAFTDALVNAKISGSQLAVDPRCRYCF